MVHDEVENTSRLLRLAADVAVLEARRALLDDDVGRVGAAKAAIQSSCCVRRAARVDLGVGCRWADMLREETLRYLLHEDVEELAMCFFADSGGLFQVVKCPASSHVAQRAENQKINVGVNFPGGVRFAVGIFLEPLLVLRDLNELSKLVHRHAEPAPKLDSRFLRDLVPRDVLGQNVPPVPRLLDRIDTLSLASRWIVSAWSCPLVPQRSLGLRSTFLSNLLVLVVRRRIRIRWQVHIQAFDSIRAYQAQQEPLRSHRGGAKGQQSE